MTESRAALRTATFTVPITDEASLIQAERVTWSLLDDRGAVIAADDVPSYAQGDDAVTFSIPAEVLDLSSTTVPSEGREYVVTFEGSNGTAEIRDFFLLVAQRPLILMANSFMTYPEVLALRQSFGPTLDGWDATIDQATRSGALAEAHQRLLRMSFKVPFLDGMTHASSYAAYGTGTDFPFDKGRRIRLGSLTLEQFDALPEAFRRAVKRAQLVEANILLGGDRVGKKRQDGIISETIGESSVFFSSKPYLNLPISRQAYDEVKRYVVFKIGVLRG